MDIKPGDKILVLMGVVFLVLAITLPFILTTPIASFLCDLQATNGWCAPFLDPFVFFGILTFFALVGMLIIYTSMSRKTKR